MDLVEVLSFIFMLSTTDLGQVSVDTNRQPQIINILENFRIIQLTASAPHRSRCWKTYEITDWFGKARFALFLTYWFVTAYSLQASSRRFNPTRLATTLTSSAPSLPTSISIGGASQDQGFIVLETNYRLYAYTGIIKPCYLSFFYSDSYGDLHQIIPSRSLS